MDDDDDANHWFDFVYKTIWLSDEKFGRFVLKSLFGHSEILFSPKLGSSDLITHDEMWIQ